MKIDILIYGVPFNEYTDVSAFGVGEIDTHKTGVITLNKPTMKKTLSNLKQVNHFIEETEKSIKEVKGWKETFCKSGEKAQELAQLNANLARHKEVKLRVLEALKSDVDLEIEELTGCAVESIEELKGVMYELQETINQMKSDEINRR